jgi:hypothetical protein
VKIIGGRLIKLLAALPLLIGGVVATASAAQAVPATVRPAAVASICANSPIPSGWVISGVRSGFIGCGGYAGYFIQTPTNGMTVCANSPIPSGWVISGVRSGFIGCDGYAGYFIQTPTNGMTVCANSPIPSGWIVTGVRNGFIGCDGYAGYTLSAA